MAWTETARAQHDRRSLRYASDVTDGEWEVIAPFMPPPSKVGRPREVDMREVWNAIQYIASGGIAWALLPKDFPPSSTVRYWFYRFRNEGLLELINDVLAMAARRQEGREAEPTAGVIDSQSVKTTESGGPRGYDAGKKIKGRKRHIVTDTLGLLLACIVHQAGVQDRDGARITLDEALERFPSLRHFFADGGYRGEALADFVDGRDARTIEIVKRPEEAKGFFVLAKTMGRRAHIRMAWPMSTPRKGLGDIHRILRGMDLHRFNPLDLKTPRQSFSADATIFNQALSV